MNKDEEVESVAVVDCTLLATTEKNDKKCVPIAKALASGLIYHDLRRDDGAKALEHFVEVSVG